MATGFIHLHRELADHDLWKSESFSRGQAWVDLLLLANWKEGHVRIRGVRVELDRGQLAAGSAFLADRWKWSRGKVKRFLDELETVQQIEQQKTNITTVVTITNYDRYQNADTKQDSKRSASGQQNFKQCDSIDNACYPYQHSREHEMGQQTGQQNEDISRCYNDNNETEIVLTGRKQDSKQDSKRTANRTANGQQTDTQERKDNKGQEGKKVNKAPTGRRFVKPTFEEIRAYCLERNNSVDADAFLNYYESNGWKVGKNAMKDWRAAVRTWEKNSKPSGSTGSQQWLERFGSD